MTRLKVGDKVIVSNYTVPNPYDQYFEETFHGVVEKTDMDGHVVWVRTEEGVPTNHLYRWQMKHPHGRNGCLYVYSDWCVKAEYMSLNPPEVAPVESGHVMGLDKEEIDEEAFREFMKGL